MKSGERAALNKMAHLSSVETELRVKTKELSGILGDVERAKKDKIELASQFELLNSEREDFKKLNRRLAAEQSALNSERAGFDSHKSQVESYLAEREEKLKEAELVFNSRIKSITGEIDNLLHQRGKIAGDLSLLLSKKEGVSLEFEKVEKEKREEERKLSLLQDKQGDEIETHKRTIRDLELAIKDLDELAKSKNESVQNFKAGLMQKDKDLQKREQDILIREMRHKERLKKFKENK